MFMMEGSIYESVFLTATLVLQQIYKSVVSD